MAYTAEDVHNAKVDALQRGAAITAQRLRERFPDNHELNQFMMSVLFSVMGGTPAPMLEAVAKLDNEVHLLLGNTVMIDPLLTIWSGR